MSSHSIIALHGIGNAETEERNLLRAPGSAFSSMDRIPGFEPGGGSSILSGLAIINIVKHIQEIIMRTTTVVRTSIELSYPLLEGYFLRTAASDHITHTMSVLEAFKTAHGVTTDNLVSQSEGAQRATVRSWPDLATAQAWVDVVLSGALAEGLDYPAVIISAQVDPE